MSFKYGEFQGLRNDRYFTDLTEENLKNLLDDVDGLALEAFKITSDVRPERENEKWLNAFYRRK